MRRELRAAGPRPRREGAVMLIVMLVLLVATAMASASLQTTQFELRASGHNRLAVQTQYVAESAMATTLSWVDGASQNGGFLQQLQAWTSPVAPPPMLDFGEPNIDPANRHMANRTLWSQQALLQPAGSLPQGSLPPIAVTGVQIGPYPDDPLGTFGPRERYVTGALAKDTSGTYKESVGDYIVDLYDCQQLPNTGTPGWQVNQGGSGTLQQQQFYCVITSRGRSFVGGLGLTRSWTTNNGAYTAHRFAAAQDARGTLITPPM